jgi:hypothetical protein
MARSKYDNLTEFLTSMKERECVVSFGELEELLGFVLPASARTHPSWWANTDHAQGRSWRRVGWRTAGLDLKNERVTFSQAKPHLANSRSMKLGKIIAEAKSRLSVSLGVELEQIEITVAL